jgi:hypothetical protein
MSLCGRALSKPWRSTRDRSKIISIFTPTDAIYPNPYPAPIRDRARSSLASYGFIHIDRRRHSTSAAPMDTRDMGNVYIIAISPRRLDTGQRADRLSTHASTHGTPPPRCDGPDTTALPPASWSPFAGCARRLRSHRPPCRRCCSQRRHFPAAWAWRCSPAHRRW